VLFLACDDSSFMTGAALVVDAEGLDQSASLPASYAKSPAIKDWYQRSSR
jgi:hypothetical protein